MLNRVGITFNSIDPRFAFSRTRELLEGRAKLLTYGTTSPDEILALPLEIVVEIDQDWDEDTWDKFVNELREESEEARIEWHPLDEKWQGSQSRGREE